MAKTAIRRIIEDTEISRKTLKRVDDFLSELEELDVLSSRQAASARKLIEQEQEAFAERKRAEELRIKKSFHGRRPPKKKK